MGAIAVSPSDLTTIFAGTGEADRVERRAEVRYLCDRQAICYELPAQ